MRIRSKMGDLSSIWQQKTTDIIDVFVAVVMTINIVVFIIIVFKSSSSS